MEEEDSDGFEVLQMDDFMEAKEVSENRIDPVIEINIQEHLSQNELQEKETTIFLAVKNQFEEDFNQPIRKKSTVVMNAWSDEEQQNKAEIIGQAPPADDGYPSRQQQHQSQILLKNSINLNQSIFTDRTSQKMVMPLHQTKVQANKKTENKLKKQEVTVKKEKNMVVDSKKQNSQITVLEREGTFWWYQDFQVEIDILGLQILYDQMFTRECFIPIFPYRIFQNWLSLNPKDKNRLQSQAYHILKGYLQKYTDFLNQKQCIPIFREVLLNLKDIQDGKAQVPKLKTTVKSFLSFDMSSLVQGLKKMIKSSKTEILRKAVLLKIQSLSSAKWYCDSCGLKQQNKLLKEKQAYYWSMLSQIDMLLSLESTQQYCSKKLQGNSESKFRQFWWRYRTSIRQSIQFQYKTKLQSINF